MSSEIEPHITKKYEIKKRLGKGVRGFVIVGIILQQIRKFFSCKLVTRYAFFAIKECVSTCLINCQLFICIYIITFLLDFPHLCNLHHFGLFVQRYINYVFITCNNIYIIYTYKYE